MIVWLILCIIACRLTISIYKQRKFYRSAGVEVFGTVLHWNRKKVNYDKMYPVHYELEVEANGQQYFIETANPKARKYKKKTDIILIMIDPDVSIPDGNFPESGHQFRNTHHPAGSLYSAFQGEIDQMNNAINQKSAIIKEDVKPFSELIAGIILTIMSGFLVITYFIDLLNSYH